jgi:hypothetical protein
MNNLVEACLAGNAKNMRNRSTLPRNFSATDKNKKSRLVPKLVLRHVLSGNIQLVAFWNVTTNHGPKFFDLSLFQAPPLFIFYHHKKLFLDFNMNFVFCFLAFLWFFNRISPKLQKQMKFFQKTAKKIGQKFHTFDS